MLLAPSPTEWGRAAQEQVGLVITKATCMGDSMNNFGGKPMARRPCEHYGTTCRADYRQARAQSLAAANGLFFRTQAQRVCPHNTIGRVGRSALARKSDTPKRRTKQFNAGFAALRFARDQGRTRERPRPPVRLLPPELSPHLIGACGMCREKAGNSVHSDEPCRDRWSSIACHLSHPA